MLMSRANGKDVRAAVRSLSGDARTVRNDLSNLVSAIADMVERRFSSGEQAVSRAATAVQDTAEDSYRGIQDLVQERPTVACAIALGLGVVLGMLLLPRR